MPMKNFLPPVLHNAIIISDDPLLAAQLSALLAQKGKYLPVIDGPRMTREDAEAEVIRRNNAVARSGARKILIAKIDNSAINMFSKMFPDEMTLKIDHLDAGLQDVLSLPTRSGVPLRWGKVDIGIGLLKALQARVPIEFVDDPDECMTKRYVSPHGQHLVVSEDGNELSQVIAANYAYSIGAGLLLMKAVPSEDAEILCEEFYSVYENREESISSTLQRLSKKMRDLIGEIPLDGITGITFISNKVPWGFSFAELPTTHLFSYPDLGIAIINGVAAEQPGSPPMRLAAVVDPATIPSTEVVKMAQAMAERGILVRGFRGPNATVNDFLRMLELLPYDLLLIATHCGDAGGWRETYRFVDGEGKDRTFVMDTAVAKAETSNPDRLEVTIFERFVSLDGVAWNDKVELKKIIGNSVNDFFKVPLTNRKADERVEIDRVVSSAAMAMFDGNVLMNLRTLSDNLTPVILNNACASWHELALRFVFANSRAYIGTLFPVVGSEAEVIAEQVLKKHFGKPLAVALWRAQNEAYKEGIRRPYLLVGVHYQKLSSTFDSSHEYLFKRMTKSLSSWEKRRKSVLGGKTDEKESVENKIEFIKEEIFGLNMIFKNAKR